MKRKYEAFLENWICKTERKPLVIRGARQVGKTWLVRAFAQEQKRHLFELNFEKEPALVSAFTTNDPTQILLNLSPVFGRSIDPATSLLFLDEIQAAPELLAKLRWFAEDLPQLPIIAAGSLLEFVLEKHTFSMPVGRISYMYMEPFSFEEFIVASGQEMLLEYLEAYTWDMQIPAIIHDKLTNLFKEYIIVGGMPAAVSSWIKNHSLLHVNEIHRDLIATYRDDFAKYGGRIDKERLDDVLMAAPRFLGEKFIYSHVRSDVRSEPIKQALELLCKARVCHKVTSAHANGIPLGAEKDPKFFKVVFLDVGLCSAILDITFDQVTSAKEITLINRGGIAEQVVGQLLRTINQPYIEPELYYWLREGKNSAEIDYLIQHGTTILPIEVKAGSTGSLKSLHLFIDTKQLSLAVRVNSNYPSQMNVEVKDQKEYMLKSLPFYLLGQLHRLLKNR